MHWCFLSVKMLEFLKKIFKNEEQEVKKVIEINLQNLEEWLNEKAKPLMEEIRQQIDEILMKINEELQRARINMEINNRNYFYLLNFCRGFDELISDLNKSTLRSYTILQEFFANETSKIAQNLKNFDTLFAELMSVLNNENIVAANNAIERIQSLKTRTKQKINMGIDFKISEAGIKLANNEKNTIMADIEKFKIGRAH